MSRTTNTTPYWVRAVWFEPYHVCRQYHSRSWQKWNDDCNLPAEPVRQHPQAVRQECRQYRYSRCYWTPIYDHANRWPHGPSAGPPKWFRQHHWDNMIRTLLRAQLGEARKQHRGSGDIDIIADTRQHRHGAGWDWL
jgi:hypothetical protein